MKTLASSLVLIFAFAACTSDEPAGPTSSTSSSTTTIVDDSCDRVVEDTVDFVQLLIDELDQTRLIDFRERDAWGEDLERIERSGADLDIRVAALGCDGEAIRLSVLERADLAASGPLSDGLVAFLLAPPEPVPTTTTTTVATTTTTVATEG